MKIEVELDHEMVDDIVRQRLVQAMKDMEVVGGVDEVDTYDAVSETVAYFSSRDQLVDMSFRDIPKEWNEIVLEAAQ